MKKSIGTQIKRLIWWFDSNMLEYFYGDLRHFQYVDHMCKKYGIRFNVHYIQKVSQHENTKKIRR